MIVNNKEEGKERRKKKFCDEDVLKNGQMEH